MKVPGLAAGLVHTGQPPARARLPAPHGGVLRVGPPRGPPGGLSLRQQILYPPPEDPLEKRFREL